MPRSFKARPTTDFAKENLFNVLANRIDLADNVSALDLFAGTGSISLELLSRGCQEVVSVEKDRDHFAFICKIRRELNAEGWKPVHADVFRFLKSGHGLFDFVFADPPYELSALDTLPDLVLGSGMLKEGGLFVLEHGKKNVFDAHPHFSGHRAYGSVNFSFFS